MGANVNYVSNRSSCSMAIMSRCPIMHVLISLKYDFSTSLNNEATSDLNSQTMPGEKGLAAHAVPTYIVRTASGGCLSNKSIPKFLFRLL